MTHAWTLQFESFEDREYYLNKDPVHLEHAKLAWPHVEKGQLMVYEHGVIE